MSLGSLMIAHHDIPHKLHSGKLLYIGFLFKYFPGKSGMRINNVPKCVTSTWNLSNS